MTTVSMSIPLNVAAWQAVCQECGSRYAVMHDVQEDAPRPVYCSFCAHRAAFYRVPAEGGA